MINRTVSNDEDIRKLESVSPWAAVLHHRLIAWLDVNGNVRGDGAWIKANVMPLAAEVSVDDCDAYVAEMAALKLAQFYQAEGLVYLHFPKFGKNQPGLRKEREKPEHPSHRRRI